MQNLSQYEIAAVFSTILSALMGIFVLIKGNSKVTRLYGFYTLAISGWSFCWFSMIHSQSQAASLFWARALHFPAGMIPATYLHFTQSFLNIERRKIQRTLRYCVYLIGFLFIVFSFHPQFVESSIPKLGFRYYLNPGPVYLWFVFFFLLVICIINFLIFNEYRKSSRVKKIQIKYTLIGYLIGYAGGAAVFLPDYGVQLPAFSLYLIPIGLLILAYSILRFRFMDLRLIIKESSKYLITSGLISILGAYIFYLMVPNLKIVFLILGFVLLTPYMFIKFNQWMDVEISRRGLTSREKSIAIKSIADRIQEAGYKISDLADTVTKIIFDDIPVSMCGMFVIDHDKRNFVLQSQEGMRKETPSSISPRDPLVKYLEREKNILVLAEAQQLLEPDLYELISKSCSTFGAEVAAPLLINNVMAGFLVFGEKENKKPYFMNEINRINEIAAEASRSLRYTSVMEKYAVIMRDWTHSLNQMTKPIASAAGNINEGILDEEEIKEATSVIIRRTKQLQEVHDYMWNSSGLTREVITGKFAREIQNIREVVRVYANDFKMENKKLFAMNLGREEFMAEINKTSIERVLLELFSNSLRHSECRGSDQKIILEDKIEGNKYTVTLKDNGEGVDPADIDKVWEPGWQTKDVNTGASGLGLAICRQMIEAHDGRITAKSPGKDAGMEISFTIPRAGRALQS